MVSFEVTASAVGSEIVSATVERATKMAMSLFFIRAKSRYRYQVLDLLLI